MLRTSAFAYAVIAGVASLAFGSTAFADGMEGGLKGAPAPAPALRDGWSGLYIGAGGGAGRIDRSGSNDKSIWGKKEHCQKGNDCGEDGEDWEQVDYWGPISFPNPFSEDDWEGFGTIQIGYDRLLGDRLLIGAFADVDIYGGSGDTHKDYFIKDSFELNHTWNVGGRIGALVTPRVLLYGVGGYTRASFDKSVHFGRGPRGRKFDDFDSQDGWFAGGGAEVKLRKGVGLKFEYRYADYGSFSDGDSWASRPRYREDCNWVYRTTFGKEWTVKDDLEIQSVRAVLVFRLDEPEAPAPLK